MQPPTGNVVPGNSMGNVTQVILIENPQKVRRKRREREGGRERERQRERDRERETERDRQRAETKKTQ